MCVWLFHKFLRMIDVHVQKLGHVERIIRRVAVCIDHAVRPYFLPYHWDQRCALHICDWHRVHFAAALQQAKDNHLTGRPAPSLTFVDASEITFVNFDFTTKPRCAILLCVGNHAAQFVKKTDR